jgi:hypothetical protein
MKVVANIQIYLHAKFHIFLRSPSISPILFSPAVLFNWKKDLIWKKSLWAVFSAVGPALHRPGPSSCASQHASRYRATIADRRGSSPKSPLLCSLTWQHRPNCRRRAGHPSPPHATRMVACSPATLSHRFGYGAPWHPITAALVGVAPIGFWSRPLGYKVLEQAAPLAKLSLPNECCGGHHLALPTCA